MTASHLRTIALIDPLWVGHHPMYFTQFTIAFLRLGCRVIGLCPDPDAARRNLHDAADGFDLPPLDSVAHFYLLRPGKRSWFGGRFEGDPLRTFQRWQRAAEALDDAEIIFGHRAERIFFPYLDSYLRFLPISTIPDLTIARPFSGLYLRNHHHSFPRSFVHSLRLLAKGDHLLRSPWCQGIGVLDERFNPTLETFTRKPVWAFPDVTDPSLPAEPSPLAETILREAAGRPVVGLIGLEKRKGFLTFLRTAKAAHEAGHPWFFAAAGVFHPGEFLEAERREIEEIRHLLTSSPQPSLHFVPDSGRIPEESGFNAVFRTFRVAWAAYESFQGSSGTLSKAAHFETLCLGTASECIGERLRRYRIGLTIPEADIPAALTGIRLLIQQRAADGAPLEPDFAAYRRDHSLDHLDAILRQWLQLPDPEFPCLKAS